MAEKGQNTRNKKERIPYFVPVDPLNEWDKDKKVIVNGKLYAIKRGRQVLIPQEVYEVLKQEEENENKIRETYEERKNEFAKM